VLRQSGSMVPRSSSLPSAICDLTMRLSAIYRIHSCLCYGRLAWWHVLYHAASSTLGRRESRHQAGRPIRYNLRERSA
jgi:hypothetical protein